MDEIPERSNMVLMFVINAFTREIDDQLIQNLKIDLSIKAN